MPSTSLTSLLRRRIKDTRYVSRAFGLAAVSDDVTSAVAEITNNHLIVEFMGGTVPSLNINLADQRFNTVGKLHQALSRSPGLRASLDEDASVEHLSIDIEPFGPTEIKGYGIDLKHRLFSDFELEEVLTGAIRRHNPSFNLQSVPENEQEFVLQLAHANICRMQAVDSTKRRGLDADAASLLSIATSYETAYHHDTTRLNRALQAPKEANPNVQGQGDVSLGSLVRRSARTGFQSPVGASIVVEDPVLHECEDRQIEDENLRIRWERNTEAKFHSYELWMDSRPDVQRTREGLTFAATPYVVRESDQSSVLQTTSKLAFRSFGGNTNRDRHGFSSFVEQFGQLVTDFNVHSLEPETDYYFRLYVIDLNYQVKGSNVIHVRTRALRTRFKVEGGLSATIGPAGTVVTVTFNDAKGAYTSSHSFKIGEKSVTPTIISPYVVEVTIPSFVHKGQKDFSVISPNGLVDVKRDAFQVT